MKKTFAALVTLAFFASLATVKAAPTKVVAPPATVIKMEPCPGC